MTQLTFSPYLLAEQWARKNPAAYSLIVRWARQANAEGRKASMQSCIERLRDRGGLVSDTPYKFDHRLRAELTRYVEEAEGVEFRKRRSRLDEPGVVNAL